jgi:hypothetical protein
MKKRILSLLMFITLFIICSNIVKAENCNIVNGYCCPDGYTAGTIEKNSDVFCLDQKYTEEELKKFKVVNGTSGGIYNEMSATIQGTKWPCDNVKYVNCSQTAYSGGTTTWKFDQKVGTIVEKTCFACSASGQYVWDYKEPDLSCRNEGWTVKAGITEKNCNCGLGFSCDTRSKCEDKREWLKKCEYKKVGKEERTYIYFDSCLVRVFDGDIDVTEIPENKNIAREKISNSIKIYDVLNKFHTDGSCPKYMYKNITSNVGSSGNVPSNVEYSLVKGGDHPEIFILQGENETIKNIGDDDYKTCKQLIGDKTLDLINTVMKWIRICVPILLIGMGVLDFATATFSSKEEDMKKNREKFIKRIIAAVLVFLAPIFINLMLKLANSAWSQIGPDTCIK